MTDGQPTLESLVAELAQLRATIATQHDTIAQQHSRIAALEGRPVAPVAEDQHQPTEDTSASAIVDLGEEQTHDYTTSRRGLLRGAAAATAAAAVATVAVGGVQQAHAAPLADGGNMILGTTNSASSTTAISDSAGTASYLLEVSSYSTSTPSAAIHGQTTGGGAGVLGESYGGSGAPYVPGIGVQGASRGDTGVYGVDYAAGVGVEGATDTGVGVVGIGRGSGSWGVVGQSSDSVDLAAYGTGLIYQWLTTLTAPPSGAFAGGESIRLANGELWICVAAGNPAPWAKVATLAPGATAGGAITYLSKPLRLLDTRPGQPAVNHPGSPYLAGSTHSITVSGASNGTVTVPAGCVGAIGNLTVIGLSGGGNYVELVPGGVGFQGTSNLNFAAGQLVANSYNVGLNASGALDIILGSGGNADVILDLYAVIV